MLYFIRACHEYASKRTDGDFEKLHETIIINEPFGKRGGGEKEKDMADIIKKININYNFLDLNLAFLNEFHGKKITFTCWV